MYSKSYIIENKREDFLRLVQFFLMSNEFLDNISNKSDMMKLAVRASYCLPTRKTSIQCFDDFEFHVLNIANYVNNKSSWLDESIIASVAPEIYPENFDNRRKFM